MWVALKLHTHMEVTTRGVTTDFPIANTVDFSIGCLMVFGNMEDAIKHAGDENSVIEISHTPQKIG